MKGYLIKLDKKILVLRTFNLSVSTTEFFFNFSPFKRGTQEHSNQVLAEAAITTTTTLRPLPVCVEGGREGSGHTNA